MDAARSRQASGRGRGVHRLPPRRWRSCPPAGKRSSTPRKRASSSRPSPTRCEVLGDENGDVVRHDAAWRWSWANRMLPAAAVRSSRRAASLCWMWTRVIMAIGTTPNPLIRNTTPGLGTNRRGCIVADERRRPDHAARACMPAATPSPARRRSSSPWARANTPRRPSTNTSWRWRTWAARRRSPKQPRRSKKPPRLSDADPSESVLSASLRECDRL